MTHARVTGLLAFAGCAVSAASAAQPLAFSVSDHECTNTCEVQRLERILFGALPADQRMAIARGAAEQAAASGASVDEAYGSVSHLMSRESYDAMRPEWKLALETIPDLGNQGKIAACFEPGTDPAVAFAFDQVLFGSGERFQPGERWSSTALSGGGLGQGDPTIITYSYVPDGTFISNQGFGSGGSQLFNWLNGIYGSPATWQALFDQVFDRWEELSGNTYVYEPNDDGVTHEAFPGVAGVRGDVRIGALSLDGNGGVLAYNFFPQSGDMVLDAFDSFYSNTGGQSLRLRNILAHEHGHGKGMFHVCPANQTKLMEPFISTAYDGPQLDDTLLAQRFYGDPLEDNDNVGQATPLSSAPIQTIPQISIDDNSDVDFFAITVGEPQELVVTATPTGLTYTQGPQTQQCNTGSSYDSLRIHDLDLAVLDTDGSTVLEFADDNGLGQNESITAVLEDAGTYYIRVRGDNTNSVQAYTLFLALNDLPFIPLDIDLVGTVPNAVDPGVTTPVTVNIDVNDEVLTPGSASLRFRDDGGSFQTIALTPIGGGDYQANLPASLCGASPEFFFQAEGDQSGVVTLPDDGAADPFSALVGEIDVTFSDNFNGDQGWTVTNSAGLSDGAWERTIPSQGGDDRIADPASDFDGSAFCYITDNGADNSDVDGGSTTLTSPNFDVSESPEARISYARWYDNNEGGTAAEAFTETFVIEISGNGGGSWVNLETVGPTGSEVSGGWFEKSFRIADFVTPSSNVRVRFIASDDVGTVVEAGVDAVRVDGLICEDPTGGPCNAADLAEPFGVLDLADISAFTGGFVSQDPIADLAAPFGVFDLADVNAFVVAFSQGCP